MRSCWLLLLPLSLAVGVILAAPPVPLPGREDEAAREELRRLERLAANPRADAEELWQGLVQLRRLDPGGAGAARVRQLLTGVRSPLDRLDPKQIPEGERFTWQPKGLVAVLGEHSRRHWTDHAEAAFSPDGKLVASVAVGDGLRLWDAATMQQKAWLKNVWSFAFAPDGKTLAVGEGEGDPQGIHLYELAGGRLKPGPWLRKKNHRLWSLTFAEGAGADGGVHGK